jgi:VanZ family protein
VISLWGPVAVYMAAIYFGAALPATPAVVSGISDTVLHLAANAGLALLTLRAVSGGRWAGVSPRAMAIALAITTLHGMSVEVEQMFVPTRFAEWRDVGNDVIGALLGLSAAWAWGKLFKE